MRKPNLMKIVTDATGNFQEYSFVRIDKNEKCLFTKEGSSVMVDFSDAKDFNLNVGDTFPIDMDSFYTNWKGQECARLMRACSIPAKHMSVKVYDDWLAELQAGIELEANL